MIAVNAATKNAYKSTLQKTLTISFPALSLTFTNDDIDEECLSIEEILESNEYLQFTGCNASKAVFSLFGITSDFKGQYVTITIQSGETEVIPLFHGYVDSQSTRDYVTSTCEFTCYDVLYTLSSIDIAQWYISTVTAGNTITVKNFRDSLFNYLNSHYSLGITVETATLVNDSLEFTKQFSPVQMCALDIIKYICQLNGVYGLINRSGNFEFRTLPKISSLENYETIEYYKNIDYQRFTALGIGKVTVRQNDQVAGVTYGNGTNTYIMQGNFFTMGLEDEDLLPIAESVYPKISDRPYVPFSATIEGYPWIEVGDILTYNVYDYRNNTYTPMQFYVMSRTLNGIQALFDDQKADGDKERSVFLSDINAQIETIKNQIESLQGQMESLSLTYVMFYNEGEVVVPNNSTRKTPVASNSFSVSNGSQVRIDMEYLLQCESEESESGVFTENDIEVTLFYEFDGVIIDSRTPKETWMDGDHILHTYYIIEIHDNFIHTWRTLLQCNGGTVTVPAYGAMNTILGLGTVTGDLWDGKIRAEDYFNALAFPFDIKGFTDSAEATVTEE